MASTNTPEDRVTGEEGMGRLADPSRENSNTIIRLEHQIDEIIKNFDEYREQNAYSPSEEIRRDVSLFQNSRILIIIRNPSYITDASLPLPMFHKQHINISGS